MKPGIVITIVSIAVLSASCATKKTGYRPPKRSKKDCDCPRWSYLPLNIQPTPKTASFV